MGFSNQILLVLGGAAIVGALAGVAPRLIGSSAAPVPTSPGPTVSCAGVDGDTLRCEGERIRLLGIDAPELPGHCAQGRDCAPGDPFASTQSLRRALLLPLRIDRVGTDRYGRTLALVSGAKGDLSCWQLNQHQAIYKPRWDNDGRLARICAAAR
ncbi:thermonuclease family protein [Sphingomonas sp. CJ20]